MKNKELYFEKFVKTFEFGIDKNTNEIYECTDTWFKCKDCLFQAECEENKRKEAVLKWGEEEGNLPTIPLDSPIDTKVIVWNNGNKHPLKRYLYKVEKNGNRLHGYTYLCFNHGVSSFSADSDFDHYKINWDNCVLYENEEQYRRLCKELCDD